MKSKNSSEKLSPRKKPKGVLAKSINAVMITVQATAGFLIVPAAISAGTSPGSTVEKTIKWAQVPKDLIEWIASIPKNIETVESLDELLDDKDTEGVREALANAWNKTKLSVEVGTEVWSQVTWYAVKQLYRLKQGWVNMSQMPIETLISMLLVMLLYFSISIGSKTLRLKDEDGYLDEKRKKLWRSITKMENSDVIYNEIANLGINQEEALVLLNKITEEITNRG